ncbi:hypothetical protein TrCOL_g13719, partial [Triparma columacea]
PHVINACLDAVDGFMVSLGPNVLLMYVVQGLFHPAKRVREVYWRVYNNLYMYASHALVATYPRIRRRTHTRSANFVRGRGRV